jgi:hypothetical protein
MPGKAPQPPLFARCGFAVAVTHFGFEAEFSRLHGRMPNVPFV